MSHPLSRRGRRLLPAALAALVVATAAPAVLAAPAHADDASPVFLTQPADVQAVDGQSASFAVTYVAGIFVTSRQWFRDTTDDGVQNGVAIAGATTDAYTLTAGTADDGARFYVRVQALVDGKLPTVYSRSALLSVGTDPIVVTEPPADQAVQAYQRARFSVAVEGSSPRTYQWQRSAGDGWADLAGATGTSYAFKTAPADNGARFRVVVDNPYGEPVPSAAATVTVHAPTGTATPVDDASLAWSVNNIYQGGNPAGTGCSFFSATRGTDFVAQKDDVRIVHADADGGYVNVTDASKCLPDNGGTVLDQLVLLTGGDGVANPVTGEAHVAWTGAVTLNAYGGLLPWHLVDPELTVAADGTGTLTATAGGLGATMEDPDDTHAIPDREVTVATFGEVELTEHGVAIAPDYSGVDYYPLLDDGTRATTSAIPAATKATTPSWGSWPESFVDFQYETGLSTYWHTSGLSADPDKSPHPIAVTYDGAPAVRELPAISTNPAVAGDLPLINGRTAVVHAEIDDADTLQWQRLGGTTWTDVAGATTGDLTIDPVATSWNGASVRLLATNDQGGRFSASLRITTANYVAPAFTQQPVAADVVADTLLDVAFTAVATPALDLSTMSVEIARGGPADEQWAPADVTVSAASTTEVRIDRVPEDYDGARLRIVVSSIEGERAVSAPFAVTVHPNLGRPQIVALPGASIDPAGGQTLTLMGANFFVPDRPTPDTTYALDVGLFAATDWPPTGDTNPREHWLATSSGSSNGQLFHNTLVGNGGTFTITLEVPTGTLADGASYGIGTFLRHLDIPSGVNTYTNRDQDSWTPLAVGSQVAPSVTTDPVDVATTAPALTRDVAFEVAVTGSPEPTVAWQTRRPGGVWQDSTVTGARAELPVTAADDGLQVRAVATGSGVAVSRVATLRLTDRPTTTVLEASATSQTYATGPAGQVRLTATVSDDEAAIGTGSVRFTDGASDLGVVDVVDGRATLTLARTLGVGSHRVVATYVPAAGSRMAGSTSPTTVVTVRRAPVVLGVTLTTTRVSGVRTLVVHVRATASGVVPAGPVRITVRKPSGRVVTRAVVLRDGVATLRVPAAVAGGYQARTRLAAGSVTGAAIGRVVTRRLG